MKRPRLLLTVMFLLCSAISFAQEVMIDNINYYVTTQSKTATVYKQNADRTSGDIVIPETITYKNKTYSVTGIGQYAFYRCTKVRSIVIPNSVKAISSNAFENCTGLTSIEIPNSDVPYRGFTNCTNLTNVTIGNGAKIISDEAFYNCTSLRTVTIGSEIEIIGQYAFAECDNLADVYCFSTTVPSANVTVFDNSYPKAMTLHVPEEAIDNYKATTPWSFFGNIVKIENTNNINTVPNTTAYITSKGGSITVQIPLEEETVEVYTIDGAFVGVSTINNGIATIQTGMPQGTIIIIKIGAKSIKTVIQ